MVRQRGGGSLNFPMNVLIFAWFFIKRFDNKKVKNRKNKLQRTLVLCQSS
jgi:hypothetical protein